MTTLYNPKLDGFIELLYNNYLKSLVTREISIANQKFISDINLCALRLSEIDRNYLLKMSDKIYHLRIERWSLKTYQEISSLPQYHAKEINLVLNEETGLKELGCNQCKKLLINIKKCGGCKGAFYCDKTCQRNDLIKHKQYCTGIKKQHHILGLAMNCVIVEKTKCSQCKKPSKTLLKCSFCFGDSYCDKKCQKEHHKIHKERCKRLIPCNYCKNYYEETICRPAYLITCDKCSIKYCDACVAIHDANHEN
jgi:hypothetical protein